MNFTKLMMAAHMADNDADRQKAVDAYVDAALGVLGPKLVGKNTVRRVAYANPSCPVADREYNLVAGGPIGTVKEWADHFRAQGVEAFTVIEADGTPMVVTTKKLALANKLKDIEAQAKREGWYDSEVIAARVAAKMEAKDVLRCRYCGEPMTRGDDEDETACNDCLDEQDAECRLSQAQAQHEKDVTDSLNDKEGDE